MRWSTICSSRGERGLGTVVHAFTCADFNLSFEDIVRESRGELSMLFGGERNGYDMFPRAW